MTQVIKTMSTLRVEAPEWHPMPDQSHVNNDSTHREVYQEEAWRTLKRISKIKKHANNVNNYVSENRHGILLDEHNEKEIEDDEENSGINSNQCEMLREIEECDKTIG